MTSSHEPSDITVAEFLEFELYFELADLRSVSRSAAACVDSMLERHLRFKVSCGTPAASWLYAHASTELQPHLRLRNGSSCMLSERFASCLSCRGSQLEEDCADS